MRTEGLLVAVFASHGSRVDWDAARHAIRVAEFSDDILDAEVFDEIPEDFDAVRDELTSDLSAVEQRWNQESADGFSAVLVVGGMRTLVAGGYPHQEDDPPGVFGSILRLALVPDALRAANLDIARNVHLPYLDDLSEE